MSEGLREYRPGLKKLIRNICEDGEQSDLKELFSYMLEWYIENYIPDNDIKNFYYELCGLNVGKFVICTKRTFMKLKDIEKYFENNLIGGVKDE